MSRNSTPFDIYVRRVGSIITAAAAASAPLLTIFPDAPPLVPHGRATVAAACAVLLVVVFRRPRMRARAIRLRSALMWLAAALVLLAGYNLLLEELTVLEPQSHDIRFQIGFGRAEWSLTPLGRRMVEEHPLWTPDQMMLGAGAFQTSTQAMLVWKPWSVRAAALLLTVMYCALFSCWIMAVAIAAKEVSAVRVTARKARKRPSSSDAFATLHVPNASADRAAPRPANRGPSPADRRR